MLYCNRFLLVWYWNIGCPITFLISLAAFILEAFIEALLHRNTGVGNQTFMYINIAKWDSKVTWDRLHTEYRPTEYNIEGIKGHAACFELANS